MYVGQPRTTQDFDSTFMTIKREVWSYISIVNISMLLILSPERHTHTHKYIRRDSCSIITFSFYFLEKQWFNFISPYRGNNNTPPAVLLSTLFGASPNKAEVSRQSHSVTLNQAYLHTLTQANTHCRLPQQSPSTAVTGGTGGRGEDKNGGAARLLCHTDAISMLPTGGAREPRRRNSKAGFPLLISKDAMSKKTFEHINMIGP